MLQKTVNGRLGNQMFQYAALRAFMLKYHEEGIRINFERVNKEGFKNELANFKICNLEKDEKIVMNKIQKIIILCINKIEFHYSKKYCNDRLTYNNKINSFEKRINKPLMKFGIYWQQQGYLEFKPSYAKNKCFFGLFESAKFFNDYRDIILQEFTPKHAPLKKNKDLYKKIENSNSICVTIRRGDFLNPDNKAGHYVCTPEYFYQAIDKLEKMVNDPCFFIFSDDIAWVKENMKFPKNVFFEDGNDPVWEKLRLMYSCKHFIISNSTFSWWAQYLSRNDKKIVIAPSRWKNTYQNDDIYEKNWVLINI